MITQPRNRVLTVAPLKHTEDNTVSAKQTDARTSTRISGMQQGCSRAAAGGPSVCGAHWSEGAFSADSALTRSCATVLNAASLRRD